MEHLEVSVYLHIPFCASKCGYCSFYSGSSTAQVRADYTHGLCNAIAQIPWDYQAASTIYFGGGTPTMLSTAQLGLCLQAVQHRYPLAPNCEVTLEANPATVSLAGLQTLRKQGFNRLSFGVQSLEPGQLSLLGRRHSAQQAIEGVQWAKAAGFTNISVDLMLGLPKQTAEHVLHFVQTFHTLGVSHISAYLLSVEEGTPFFDNNVQALCPDGDAAADLYLQAVTFLAQYGYIQYEISNFAQDSNVSRHNSSYWLGTDYLGIGPSAHSFAKGKRFYFEDNTNIFLQDSGYWDKIIADGGGGGYQERCMLGLRLTQGINLTALAQEFPAANVAQLVKRAQPFLREGYATLQNDQLALTPTGFLVSNQILSTLL